MMMLMTSEMMKARNERSSFDDLNEIPSIVEIMGFTDAGCSCRFGLRYKIQIGLHHLVSFMANCFYCAGLFRETKR